MRRQGRGRLLLLPLAFLGLRLAVGASYTYFYFSKLHCSLNTKQRINAKKLWVEEQCFEPTLNTTFPGMSFGRKYELLYCSKSLLFFNNAVMKCLKKEQLLFCNKKERESLITYEKAIIKKG